MNQNKAAQTLWALWINILDHIEAVCGAKGSTLIIYPTLLLFSLSSPVIVGCTQAAYWGLRSRGYDLLDPGLRAMLGDRSVQSEKDKSNKVDQPLYHYFEKGERKGVSMKWSFFTKPVSFAEGLLGSYTAKSNYLIGFAAWFLLGPIGLRGAPRAGCRDPEG